MKKFYALVILILFAIPAHAEEGVRLGIEGIYQAAYGVIVNDDDGAAQPQAQNRHNDAVKQFVKLEISGETQLNNGLIVGASVELLGQTDAEQIDDTVMYIAGNFGKLMAGDTDDARIFMAETAPQASRIFHADHLVGEDLSFSNNPLVDLVFDGNLSGLNTTLMNVEESSSKILYFTPQWNGFAFAVSYAPDASSDANNRGGQTMLDNDGGNSNAWSVAGNYHGAWNGNKIGVSLGYTGSDNETAALDDVSAWQAGIHIARGDFAVGGSYGLLKNGLGDDQDVRTYALGGTYNIGPATLGLEWSRGDYDTAPGRTPRLDSYVLSASCALGDGISVDAALQHDRYDNDGAGAAGSGLTATDDYRSTALMVGSAIEF